MGPIGKSSSSDSRHAKTAAGCLPVNTTVITSREGPKTREQKKGVQFPPQSSEWQELPPALGKLCLPSGPWFSHQLNECVG